MTIPAADGRESPSSADGGLSFRIPGVMHSLALDLPPQERAAHIRDVAAEVWAAGTDFQRETTAEIYSGIADGAAEDGALYAGVCFLSLEDGQPASASLVVRAEETDRTDAETVAAAVAEGLSTQPGKETYRTTAGGRPVAVVFSVTNTPLGPEDPEEPEGPGEPEEPVLAVASAEAYIPLPEIAQLLVLGISTPTLEIFPDLVALLSGIAGTVEVDGADRAHGAYGSVAAGAAEQQAAAAAEQGLRPSRILGL